MSADLEKFSAGSMAKGLSLRTMDFSDSLVLAADSYNMSQGIQEGLGPRYGMTPIPGQVSTEAPVAPEIYNLEKSGEAGSATTGLRERNNVYGIAPLLLPDPANTTKRITTYAWLVATRANNSLSYYFDIVLGSTRTSSIETISADIRKGLGAASGETENFNAPNLFAEGIVPISGARATPLLNTLNFPNGATEIPSYVSWSFGVAGGGDVPMTWIFGNTTSLGDATHAPNVSFQSCNTIVSYAGASAAAQVIAGGIPSEYNLQNFKTAQRFLKIYGLDDDGAPNTSYSVKLNPASTFFLATRRGETTTNLDVSTITATKLSGPVGGYIDNFAAIVNDPACIVNSSYKAILAASGKAYMCIFQDSWQNIIGKYQQWYDLTQTTFNPQLCNSLYSEDSVKVSTCFVFFPDFDRNVATTFTFWKLGPADSGLLRSKTTYEFTYALYNKRLNIESNVGVPVKFRTGATDFVSLQFYDEGLAPGVDTSYYNFATLFGAGVPFSFSEVSNATGYGDYTGTQNFLNFYEYRFYYRQEGTFEWLPAMQMDAARFWFFPNLANHVACVAALAATTGGQSGGFNDYSSLTRDNWNDVKIFKNRAFWFSPTQCQFSLYNNFFAYPGRNSLACPSGEFRGAILHNYPGQAEQNARLVIFGTSETYVGRFTGNKLQTAVQVSPDATGLFDIDGSDFVVDTWTSVTAFSYRAAVVAEGILYWWGPQGIFRDDGVNTPTRISQDLEPNLFTLYDPNRILDINASYNDQTKEIQWLYNPKTTQADGSIQHSLIFNVISGNFIPTRYFQQIDWVQNVNISSNLATAGIRQVIGTRKSTSVTDFQMAYFFDQRNRAGDIRPNTELIVKQVSTPATGIRRLTLATGFNANSLMLVKAGDYIAMQQVDAYAGTTTATDLIATIDAINRTAGTIDINLPTEAVLPTGTYTIPNYFAVWHKTPTGNGLSGIPYRLESTYWIPGGINGYYFWYNFYLLSKIGLWATDLSLGTNISYRSPTADALITDAVAFADNSDGNWQLYHQLQPGNDNMEGQGLKIVFSGVHIGHEWVLQYLEAHGKPLAGEQLKRFQG